MKDEIKEILEDYKKLAGEITEKLDNTAEYESWLIVQDYFDKLLDYITNLQREVRANNDLIPYFKNKEKELKKKITNLQEERNNMACLVNDLQEKIDEAIEYIKEHSNALGLLETVDNKDLLNVLQGSDE